MSALHFACVCAHTKGDYTVVQLLMEAGGDPNQPTSWNRRTPLQYARQKKDVALLDLLLPGGREEGQAGPSSPHPAKEKLAAQRASREASSARKERVRASLQASRVP